MSASATIDRSLPFYSAARETRATAACALHGIGDGLSTPSYRLGIKPLQSCIVILTIGYGRRNLEVHVILKASIDYGLRTLLYLASRNCVCSSKEISQNAGIPRDYLIQLAQQERDAGLIESRSGKNGGYIIAKPASSITLLEIIDVINGKEAAKERPAPSREHAADPLLRHAMDVVLNSYNAYLGSITLDMLLDCAAGTENPQSCLAACLRAESERLTQDLLPA